MKLKRKQKFFDIYKKQLQSFINILRILFLTFLLVFPWLLTVVYNEHFIFIYILYAIILISYGSYIFFYRFYKLSHLPLTDEEKEALNIRTAEDCIVFLNLYLRYGKNRFTLFKNNEYLMQVREFICSSRIYQEKARDENNQLYNISNLNLDYSNDCFVFDGYYGENNPNWQISDFCREYFKIALKEKWSWQQYVEENEKYAIKNCL